MANLLVWPSKYFFYAIGNTSAVALTTDLPPEEPARILLLGCGDPRNVLHTIFTEGPNSGRTLDFTCSDFDPAVLARNVLLLTMIIDNKPHSTLWNTFFHFRLDKDSHIALIDQCKKLIGHSETTEEWKASPYAPLIKFCTDYTLKELRHLPSPHLAAIHEAFDRQSKKNVNAKTVTSTIIRSLGPLGLRIFKNFWKTGRISAATILNPTFVYSLGGEGCCLHYGTDPLIPFHFAPLFGNSKGTAANQEFKDWCSSYFTSLSSGSPPIIRFFVGEATAVCRALRIFDATGISNSGIPVAQWKTQLIQLNRNEYNSSSPRSAPTSFNIIHTSNLEDHIGLLNVLIASSPLLSADTSSVLYTESLLFLGQNATKEFTEQLHVDLSVFGLLSGLSPIDYLCGFTSRSNTHELMRYQAMKKDQKKAPTVTQFYQVTTWKRPGSGDTIASQNTDSILPPVFDGYQLGTLLYDIYQSLFEQETSMNFWKANQNLKNLAKAISVSNLAHYGRESFVLLLQLIRQRLQPSQDTWSTTMERFMSLLLADWSIQSMDTLHYQDLCGQLLRHSLYRAPFLQMKAPKIGRFALWDTVPDLVRIVLVIPREKLSVLEDSKADEIGTPPLHFDIFGKTTHNVFTAAHVAFGRAISVGPKSRPQVVFEEDTKGRAGDSPLVASFVLPALVLTSLEPQERLNVGFSVRNTPAACATLIKKLGILLRVFSANLMDESLVHVLPEQPLPLSYSPGSPMPGISSQIGDSSTASVELDEQCELIASLTVRVSIADERSAEIFSEAGGKAVPEIIQLSPCVVRITLGGRNQDILIVPTSRSLLPDGMKLTPFPVIKTNGFFHPWTLHRVNLSTLPVLDLKAKKVDEWFNVHVGSMMSARELSLRKKNEVDTLMFVKDSLHSIFVRAAGTQGGAAYRLFALRDKTTKNCDTCLFISELRFDLASHTIVCDGYVLPLTVALLKKIEKPFAKLVHQGRMVDVLLPDGEIQAWKQLLPAFVERCRSWTHGPNCEYIAQGHIPLTEGMEADPLCSCGKGKDVEGMNKVALWKEVAPYVTRVALSPLFAVSYLETVGRHPDAHKCSVCRRKGNPRLKECTGCKKVRYCSAECQKKDWKTHKPKCKP
ncbi:hypothetical protein CPB84DRAFT_1769725 [Gymnopilus junonius]|uniref:MYND-type domain-containing protein n=1 Tax=Gymnopilus junonius TaxID=109634 RepID=A0A9P5NWM6_GYMJU|nr:hypothetical protein CPB84DRAFT_1769725 [Gymnopilus junonius]